MKKIDTKFCSILLAGVGLVMTSHATDVYTAMTPSGSWTVPARNAEIGNEVTAAGTDRYVTALDIEIFSQNGIFPNGTPGYADFHAQLYANDGPQGQPGSLLWQSAVETVNYPGGLSVLMFNVPDVLVPDQFTWTLQYSNTSPIPPGIPGAMSPTVGNSIDTWSRSPGSGWNEIKSVGTFMAQIQAVPEPAMGVSLSIAALTFWFWRRRIALSRD